MKKGWTINKVDESDQTCLYRRYLGQLYPQQVFIEVDFKNKNLSIDWECEIGNAVPIDVYYGLTVRYQIPILTANSANVLMKEILPHVIQLAYQHTIYWDETKCCEVGRFTSIGEELSNMFEEKLLDSSGWQEIEEWDAGDYFESDTQDWELALKEGTKTFSEIEKEIQDSLVCVDEHVVINGVDEYIEHLKP